METERGLRFFAESSFFLAGKKLGEKDMICLSDSARRAKREYMRRWRSEHKESIAISNAKYWQKKAREMGLADGSQDTDRRAESEAVSDDE